VPIHLAGNDSHGTHIRVDLGGQFPKGVPEGSPREVGRYPEARGEPKPETR